ncbi:MAG TPA: peptidase S8, partial [Armatimonadota bacterium]|nr:peptidase S8 [Armatimonadota bacterium]
MLVAYRAQVTEARRQVTASGLRAQRVHRLRGGVERLRLAPGVTTETALRALAADPAVAAAQPNFLYHADLAPNDPSYTNGSLWGLN